MMQTSKHLYLGEFVVSVSLQIIHSESLYLLHTRYESKPKEPPNFYMMGPEESGVGSALRTA